MKLPLFYLPLRALKNSSLSACLHDISFNILSPISNVKSCLVLNFSDVLAHSYFRPPDPSVEPPPAGVRCSFHAGLPYSFPSDSYPSPCFFCKISIMPPSQQRSRLAAIS